MELTPQIFQAIRQINTLISGLVDESTHVGVRQQLLEIISQATGYAYGLIAEVGQAPDTMEITALCLPTWMVSPVERLVGHSLVGFQFAVDLQAALETPPVEFFEHLADFHKPHPKPVGMALESLLKVKHLVSIRQHTSNTYLGAVSFAATHPHPDFAALEYLCNNHLVYALRLMHEQTEKARLRHSLHEEVETQVKARTVSLENALEQAQAAEEKLTESYLGMMKAHETEKIQLKETEGLLEGLRVLTDTFEAQGIYAGIMNLPRGLFDYEEAFILVVREDGKLDVRASTSPIFEKTQWQAQYFFKRILAGEPVAVFETKMVAEWAGQPKAVIARAGSALHIPLLTGHTQAILIYTHTERGKFTQAHQKLAERFTGLAIHALKNVELFEKLQHERDSLEQIVTERTEELQTANHDLQQEVAEHEKTEAALKLEKQHYQSLFEQTNDAVFFIGLDGRHLAANSRAAEMLDYKMEELLALTVREIVVPDELPFFAEKLGAMLNGQMLSLYERTFRKKDGTEFPVEVNASLVFDAEGNPLYAQSVVRDISTRKQAEQAIASLAKFPEESPFPFFRISLTGRILYANKSSVSLLETWQTENGTYFPTSLLDRFLTHNANQPTEPLTLEVKFDAQTYAFTFVPIPEMGYINVYAQNITEAKRADRMKAEFIANVSHELRTPLASILGYTELLYEMTVGELTPTQKEFLDIIYDSGQHLLMLVNDLIDVTKMETGHLDLQVKQLYPSHVMKKVYARLIPIANNKKIRFEMDLDPDLPPLLADEGRLEQVISNLLSNAIKFTPSEGAVKLRAHMVNQTHLHICVSDSGIGIHAEDLPRLFNRFYRGQNITSTAISGTGLGLYITKAIIEAHGGKITVKSSIGQGSTFEVCLPLKRSQ